MSTIRYTSPVLIPPTTESILPTQQYSLSGWVSSSNPQAGAYLVLNSQSCLLSASENTAFGPWWSVSSSTSLSSNVVISGTYVVSALLSVASSEIGLTDNTTTFMWRQYWGGNASQYKYSTAYSGSTTLFSTSYPDLSSGEIFAISYSGSIVQYYRNGILRASCSFNSVSPLMPVFRFYDDRLTAGEKVGYNNIKFGQLSGVVVPATPGVTTPARITVKSAVQTGDTLPQCVIKITS